MKEKNYQPCVKKQFGGSLFNPMGVHFFTHIGLNSEPPNLVPGVLSAILRFVDMYSILYV